MNVTMHGVLMVAAILSEFFAACGVGARVNFVALGLMFYMLTFIV